MPHTSARSGCPRDHPRVGGEKFSHALPLLGGVGSPPRGRGKDGGGIVLNVLHGITPAWAGKSAQCVSGEDLSRDHPRMGGEKTFTVKNIPGPQGSPPHGRGKVPNVSVAEILKGITPAWAGKREWYGTYHPHLQDHPRMGGEKMYKTRPDIYRQGSPPHGRGKVPPRAAGRF